MFHSHGYKNLYRFLPAGLIILGFFTIKISPLPWYDEVDFTSITYSYSNNKTFVCSANDLYFPVKGKEVLYYGPVYFVLNSAMMKLFGFGILQSRLLNFLAAIVCIYLFIKLFERVAGEKCTAANKGLLALLILSDYTYIQNMHSGRMDLLALMFVLAGLLLADISSKRMWLRFTLSGLLIAVGLLTTPRVYFIVVPYYGYLLYIYFKTRQRHLLPGIAFAGFATCLVYMAWIVLKFGSVRGYISYISAPATVFDNAAADFFMLNTNIMAYQWVVYAVLFLLLALAAWKNYRVILQPENMTGLTTIALFLLLGGGSLIYMSIISGFIYMVIMSVGNKLTGWGKPVIALLLMFNLVFMGYKYVVVLGNLNARSPGKLAGWIGRTIAPGSKVVADDKYYYAITGGGSQFQYYARGGSDAERVAYHTGIWKANYLLVGDTATGLFREYRRHANLQLLGEYKPAGVRAGNTAYTTSYEGFLFGFVR